jgi:peptidoglycan/LPS O-acetylase OafA/YrhL
VESVWFWGRKSGALVKFCLTCALEFPILYPYPLFALIAGGNNIFGFLTHPISRTLGEMAYSIYLLHGIILFVVFTFIVGVSNASRLSPLTYWMLILGIIPILIFTSFFTFLFIERPAMKSTSVVTTWLRLRLRPSKKAGINTI